ncbi:MAG: aromatic ring-hydroxylating dioxygenase subunit alpha [Terricaulis sp.]|nr:aromatic ring-hydroxylating dioxygenase subunit alpha [Terricaulis sp.]
MSDLLRDLWYFAAASRELKAGKMFRREILGEPIALGRDGAGKAFALRDICPHRAVPLSAGKVVENAGVQTIECPYHGWRFGAGDGVCKMIPTLVEGQPYEPGRIKVRHFPTYEANGIVLVYVSADPRFAGEPPPPPEFGLGDFTEPKFVIERIFAATMDNAVVGLMDPAHVPYVHNQWWWRPPSSGRKLKQKRFVPRERGWAIERHAPSGNSLAYRMLFGGEVTTEISFMLPGYRWEVVDNPKSRLFTLTCLTPEKRKTPRASRK